MNIVNKKSLIVERLCTIMNELNLNQIKLSNDLNIKQAILSRYLNEKTPPSLDFLIKFSEKYNISYDYLIGRSSYNLTLDNLVEKYDNNKNINLLTEKGQIQLIDLLINEKIIPISKVHITLLEQIISNVRDFLKQIQLIDLLINEKGIQTSKIHITLLEEILSNIQNYIKRSDQQ